VACWTRCRLGSSSRKIKGLAPPDQTAALAAKVRRANGAVQYVAMDEPVWFGHYYDGAQACHSSIDSVAERVAVNLREYLKVFPDLTISETSSLSRL